MKTTAEEKLLRQLENVVKESFEKRKLADFKHGAREAHEIATHVIRQHQHMMKLWQAMDKRTQAIAKKLTNSKRDGG